MYALCMCAAWRCTVWSRACIVCVAVTMLRRRCYGTCLLRPFQAAVGESSVVASNRENGTRVYRPFSCIAIAIHEKGRYTRVPFSRLLATTLDSPTAAWNGLRRHVP